MCVAFVAFEAIGMCSILWVVLRGLPRVWLRRWTLSGGMAASIYYYSYYSYFYFLYVMIVIIIVSLSLSLSISLSLYIYIYIYIIHIHTYVHAEAPMISVAVTSRRPTGTPWTQHFVPHRSVGQKGERGGEG